MSRLVLFLGMTGYAALLCVGGVLEALGVPEGILVRLVAIAAFAGISVAAWAAATMRDRIYIGGGRDISAFGSGAWLATEAVGIAVLLAVALPIAGSGTSVVLLLLAALAGLLIAGAAFAPAIHADEAPTVPDFLARRFGSLVVRLFTMFLAAAICCLLLILLLQAIAAGLAMLLGIDQQPALMLIAVLLALTCLPGGMKAATNTRSLYLILLTISCIAPVAWTLISPEAMLLSAASPSISLAAPHSFSLDAGAALCLAVAISALPSLLAGPMAMRRGPDFRVNVWGVAIGLLLLALVPILAHMLQTGPDVYLGGFPKPFAQSLGFEDLPRVLLVLAAMGTLMAALSVASSLLLTVANTLGHDLFYRALHPAAPPSSRLAVSRLLPLVVLALASWASTQTFDALAIVSWTLVFAAAGLFPALVLGIWWKSVTAIGTIAGMAAGVGLPAIFILGVRYGVDLSPGTGDEWTRWWGTSDLSAALAGIPAAFAVSAAASLLPPMLRRNPSEATARS